MADRLETLRAELAARSPDPAKGNRLLDPLWCLFGRDSQSLAREERRREVERSARALAKTGDAT
ncbi:MAG: hypothetical protein ACKO1J_02770 [Tagaea sp.]